MTAKRYFKEDFYDEYAIKKEDTIIAIVDSGTNARKICDELNVLHEEKEELIYALNQRTEQCDKLYEENQRLREENKELEEFRYIVFKKMNELILND